MRRALVLAVVLLALPADARAAVSLAQIGSFASPVYLTSPPGDARLFVVEQGGTVRVIRDGAVRPAPFLDVTSRITSGGERGLLSIAFAPDYATSGLFYAYFTNGNGDVEVDEFSRSAGDPDVADGAPRRTLFVVAHPGQSNHNGGQLQFGPDGLLYAGTGDGGGAGDPNGNAQNPSSRLGKLLRIDPRQSGAQPEIFSLGLRNPWRFSFDRQTGDLAIGDVGQGTIEEVDFAPAPSRGQGANYGWNRFEGDNQFSGSGDRSGLTFPVITHTHSDGWCSITGGYVVRDPTLPELAGRYVYGDYCKGDLYTANLAGGGDDRALGLNVPSLTSFGEDGCGRVYALSGNGPVYRLSSGGATCATPAGAPGGPVATPDRTKPTLGLTASHRQRRGRYVRFALRCNEQCAVTATARALDRRVATLEKRTLAAGARVGLRMTLTAAARRALARALRRHRSVVLTLRVRAADAAGNAAATRLRLRLAR